LVLADRAAASTAASKTNAGIKMTQTYQAAVKSRPAIWGKLAAMRLYIPPSRPASSIVPRPRLLEKLNEGLNHNRRRWRSF
jgi:hypothetical protein